MAVLHQLTKLVCSVLIHLSIHMHAKGIKFCQAQKSYLFLKETATNFRVFSVFHHVPHY